MLNSILSSNGSYITIPEILFCTATALVLGLVIAFAFMYRNVYTKNFVITIALLPAMVQAVIMLVNGNLGTGIAIAGAFSLVRFRSAPGNAREISGVFFAMVVGLATGMGYLAYAAIFTGILALVMVLYTLIKFGDSNKSVKSLRITIPEDMDYVHAFDDVFKTYANGHTLDKVRTTNLGGLFELQYTVNLKRTDDEKKFIDTLRQRNGNLSIICGRVTSAKDEL